MPEKRSESTSSEARFQMQAEAADIAAYNFIEADRIASLEELNEKLNSADPLPKGISILLTENKMTLYCLKENSFGRPVIIYSLIIAQDLQFSMWCDDIKLPPSKVAHICFEKISRCSMVINILIFLKNKSEEKDVPPETTIAYCIKRLENRIDELEDDQSKKVSYLTEQLKLSQMSTHSRKYSPGLLACAALWDNTSPALYRQIQKEGILTLPTKRHLNNLTSAFTVEAGITPATEQYLKHRIGSLKDREKVVNLMFDEVYSSKRVEYSNGTFYGYENQNVTKTMLCFMIKLVGGRYTLSIGL